jgi:CRP-like cAMP-binding protein
MRSRLFACLKGWSKINMVKDIDAFRISQPQNIVDCLMEIPLFDGLRGTELKTIAKHMSYFELEKNDILFREGDLGDYVCFILAGELQVLKKSSESGRKILIATLTKNRSIGEMSVIDDTNRSATVKASTRSKIIALTKRGFDLIIEKNPKIGIIILKQISRLMSMNLRKTSSQLTDLLLPLS